MSTQSIGLVGASTNSLLSTSSSGGSGMQITGLASGLDTNSIIQALMALDRKPVTDLTNQQTGLKALNQQLTSIQTSLQQVALNAQALASPGLFASSQTVASSDPTRVSATTATGAGVGGYQVAVTQLANSGQHTFTFTSPAANDTFTIGGHSTTVTAGESIGDFVNSINSDANAKVYAAATDSGTVVLSDRTSGAQDGSHLTVVDPANTLTDTGHSRPGQNAKYSIDGVPGQDSPTNTVTGAIAGVTLNLNGVTTTSGPVTVTVAPPGPSATSIQAAVKTFVDSYNSVIDQINAQLTQKPVSGDPTQGNLFGDSELSNLLGNMREAMYNPGAGLPSGIASLADIGVTTGAAAGSAGFSQDSVDGKLTIDSTALANAIQSNPNGVKQVLQSWSQSFSTIVNNDAQPGGSLDARIQGDSSQISDISDQITNLNAILADRQTALQAQFANLEALLSQSQSQSSWLAGQIASLP